MLHSNFSKQIFKIAATAIAFAFAINTANADLKQGLEALDAQNYEAAAELFSDAFEKGEVDGVVAIGVVIQGETKHFDFVCDGATQGIKDVNLKYNTPVAFCVLTDNNEQQSIDRSGGIHGNKGIECAVACLNMYASRMCQYVVSTSVSQYGCVSFVVVSKKRWV